MRLTRSQTSHKKLSCSLIVLRNLCGRRTDTRGNYPEIPDSSPGRKPPGRPQYRPLQSGGDSGRGILGGIRHGHAIPALGYGTVAGISG